MTADGDDVWIGVDGAIVHVAGSTNAQRRIAVPAMRTGNGSLAMAPDGLWIADYAGNRIERLDPATGRVELAADAPAPAGFIVIGDRLWIGSERAKTIYPVDRKTGKLGAKVGSAPGATAGLGQFWQGAAGGDIVTRLDPATGKVLGTVTVPPGSACGVGGAFPDNVWAGCGKLPGMENPAGDVVARIDPATGTVVTTARLPIFGGVVIANGVPWFFVPRRAAATTETSLVAADPATGALLATRDLGSLDLDGGLVTSSALWVSDEQGHRVVRYDIGTLRP
jgi:sugar lactone lactonase YvrE